MKKNRFAALLAFLTLGAATAVQASGCAYPGSMIYIDGVLAVDAACGAVAAPASGQTSYGTLDVAYNSQGYIAALLIGNQIVARGAPNQLKPETSRVQIYGGEVRLTNGANGSVGTGAYFDYFATTVDPGNGNTPGFSGAYARLIDPATAQTLASQLSASGVVEQLVVAEVTLFGITLGGDEVRSQPWTFPIYVCYGCLCQTPADDTCVAPENAPEPVCYIGQDVPFDCRWTGASCI
jgi:hypothetical protein